MSSLRSAAQSAALVLPPAAAARFDDALTLLSLARSRDDLARGLARILCVWRAQRDRVGAEREPALRSAVRVACDYVHAIDRVAYGVAANEAA